jgi:two-component system, cell cycle sensor histidine kinase and response regulator CckA
LDEQQPYLEFMGAAVMSLATDAVFLVEPETLRILVANAAFTRSFGYGPKDLGSLGIRDIALTDPTTIEANLRAIVTSGELPLGVRRYRRKDGTTIEMETRVGSTVVEGRTLYCVVSRDLTERRQAEQALRDSEERFRKLAEAAFEGIAITEAGTIIEANAQLASLLGTTVTELIGKSVVTFVAPESRASVEARIRSGSEQTYEHLVLRADGSVFPVEAQGKTLRVGGRTLRVTAIRDASQRKSLEEQLNTARRMESVGRLAGGVAHDFNNLLTVILSVTKLLELTPRSVAEREDLEQIKGAAERAASLTGQLLAFARRQIVEPRAVDLNELVSGVQKLLERVIGEHIELRVVLSPGLATITADPGQVEQVLMNLAVNARDAMPSGGTLTIETSSTVLDEAYAAGHAEVRPGPHAMVSVTDTGGGMPPEVVSRIFEPFFTTKASGQGTGLGLATSYGIVKQHGGSIWVYSEVGLGTTFKVYFPTATAAVPSAAAPPPRTSRGGKETVLVVEDETGIRRLAVRILEMSGYRVYETGDPERALVLFDDVGGKIDLLVADVVMAKMSGRELAERLHAKKPSLRVLYTSGYTEDTIIHHGVVDPGIHFLAKPYGPEDLTQRVREVLDG